MKKIVALLAAAVLVCGTGCSNQGAAGQAGKDESWEKVQAAGELVLGMDSAFPPMGYTDPQSGKLIGFDLDLAQEVCDRLGIKLKKQAIDWNNKESELNDGNVDCLWNGFSSTPARQEALNLSIPYMKNNQILLVMADSEYQTLDDLKGKTIGVQTDSSALDALKGEENAAFQQSLKDTIEVPDYSKAVLEMDNGSIDAIAIDEVVARFYLTNQKGKFRILEKDGAVQALAKEDFVIGFRKGDDALKNKVEETLKAMANDGKLAEISNKWFDKDVTSIQK